MVTTVVLLLAAVVLAYVGLGVLQRRRRSSIRLSDSTVLAADDSRIGSPTLWSERLRLVGRPDQLVRTGGQLIPVEQKPQAWRIQDSHVLQVAVECLLVSEVYGVRPPTAYLCSQMEDSTACPFMQELEQRLLQTLARMNGLVETKRQPGPHWISGRSRACGFFDECWE